MGAINFLDNSTPEMNFTPHFTESDYANFFTIRANAGLNDSQQGY